MTVFVGGVHGVGKTFLAKPAAAKLGMTYATASQLIRDERGRATWDSSKAVGEIRENQAALVAAVNRLRLTGHALLLDGHFVLRRMPGEHERLPMSVFRDLACTSVLLLVCPTEVVLARMADRNNSSWDRDELIEFAKAEASHAAQVCAALAIPLVTLHAPTPDDFELALTALPK